MNEPSASQVPEHVRLAYAAELKKLMTAQGWTIIALARETGISWSSIGSYRIGRVFPSPASSALLADVLMSEPLRKLGTWTVPCAVCRKPVEASSRGGHPKLYCSFFCRRQRRYDRVQATPAKKRAKAKVYRVNAALLRENKELRAAILANCLVVAGVSRLCPMLEDCVFIPYTELRKVRVA